jgi:flagellar biosynthesis protein FliP
MKYMKNLKPLSQKKTVLVKKVNKVKNSDNSNIKWLIQEVVVPIAIALIPALIPLATTYITIQNTQQPPNPAIDRLTSSK